MSEAIVNLDNCAREPIHIPGAIQPHGVLLVLEPVTLRCVQVSENINEFLHVTVEQCLAQGLPSFLNGDQIARIKSAFAATDPREHNPVQLQLSTKKDGLVLDGVVHTHDGCCFLELEPTTAPNTLYFRDFYKTVSKATSRMQLADTLPGVLEAAAEEFQTICGFDRVMIYRFAASGEGEVVAEAKIESAEPYLGLWYPASDIPEQARRLYLQNPMRIIPEVPYKAVPLVPAINKITSRPTDLSYVGLRSVSSIHCEYLMNMGVSASMSVSIVREGKLWGLVSCHHFSPRFIAFETRNACIFLGQVLSGEITRREVEGEANFSAKAIGLQGACEVEFRRDRENRPLLMEINPRLAGTLENANKSGVDFPMLIWKWATGRPVEPVLSYRTGVRTRWLSGDLRWLRKNLRHAGRPDTVSPPRAIWTFLWEFARTRHYDYIDRGDMRPALAEWRQTAVIARNRLL